MPLYNSAPLFLLFRILEVARCSQLTDVGFTTLARVSVASASWLHVNTYTPYWQIQLFVSPKTSWKNKISQDFYPKNQNLHKPTLDDTFTPCLLSLSLLQNCHELEKMDLEECVQVNKLQILFPLLLCGDCSYDMCLFLFLHQITDGTLIQLSIHCPRLQVLVSVCLPLKHILLL